MGGNNLNYKLRKVYKIEWLKWQLSNKITWACVLTLTQRGPHAVGGWYNKQAHISFNPMGTYAKRTVWCISPIPLSFTCLPHVISLFNNLPSPIPFSNTFILFNFQHQLTHSLNNLISLSWLPFSLCPPSPVSAEKEKKIHFFLHYFFLASYT